MVRRANRKRKGHANKRERKIILIAAEGDNKTERAYFTGLNRQQKEYHFVMADGNNTDPIKIVSDAVTSSQHLELDHKDGDLVFAVFDTDFGKRSQLNEARRIAKQHHVGVIMSNPCFEVWILLHFRYSTHGYHSNDDVLQDLLNRWPAYRKGIDSFQYIYDRSDVAVENARKLNTFHDSIEDKKGIEYRNSSTDVYKVIEAIIRKGSDSSNDV